MDAVVRPAVEGDLDAIVLLAEQWAAEEITLGQSAESREWFAAQLDGYLFVAEFDGAVVGFVTGERAVSDESASAVLVPGTPFLEVTDLFVTSAMRSRGVGSLLMDALLAAAAVDGIERSTVFTATKDVTAILRFYERHGYRGWGIQLVR